MSEKKEDTGIELTEESVSGDSTTVVVTDSEGYGQAQKLKHIYKAKRQVQDMRSNSEELVKEYDDYWHQTHGRDVYNRELASSVAEYGSELLPIIEGAREQGKLDTTDVTTDRFGIRISDFVSTDGMDVDHEKRETEPYSPLQSLAVYRQLNRILRDLGLGLELEENKGPAQI
jgi:hypothetical protein